MLSINTVYNVSTLRTIKMFSPKRLNSKYTISIDPILPELTYREEDQFDPSVYIETTIKNGKEEDVSSIILTKKDCMALIKELEHAIETLEGKEYARDQLEDHLSRMNDLKETHSIEIEYFSDYQACDSDSVKIYKISVIDPDHHMEVWSFVIPLYLTGIKEIDHSKIFKYISYPKDKITYGPKLINLGEKHKQERIKEMGETIKKRTGKNL